MIVQIKDILGKIIDGNAEMPRVSWEFKISNAWGKVNPANVIENATPDKLVGGILYVNAKNSTWAQQINILKSEIILKLNAFLGEIVIKDIRLKTGFTHEAAGKAKEMPQKVCGGCGVEYFGGDGLCPSCSRKTGQEKEVKLIKLVQENPKIKLIEAKRFIPNVSEIELHRTKRDVMARKADKEYRARRQHGR
jgi:uncharacterized Zn finger protein (UPF0148 family)